ncbi:thiamine pyrophosphate-binding protein [Pseudophaeobacter profundi]|uniref:thiamine pyrophosphate-binding protein n=1 Tax=Pseudophaeobacter profundi TaxID=3034152 RepID=UPI00242EB30D|nr:thiamine pyrophosphate-dependent enzyme [Pseudophaeobacter profundi]
MTVAIDGSAPDQRAEAAGKRAALLRTRLQQRQAPSGHQAIAQAFLSAGITHVYALPGNPMYATLGACAESGLQVIGCRSQSGALSAALAHNYRCGAFRAVALCSPAPGVTNSITGLSDARGNHWPMVLITALMGNAPDEGPGENGEPGPDTDAHAAGPQANFQDLDGAEIAAASCKAVVRLTARDGLAAGILQAVQLAQSVPCGPVFVEVRAGLLNLRQTDVTPVPLPAAPAQCALPPDPAVVAGVAAAQKPLLVLGEGLRWSRPLTPDKTRRLQAQVDRLQLPVLASPMGRGLLPDRHPRSTFMAKEKGLGNCDHLLLCGADLDWRFGGQFPHSAQARIDRILPDIDVLLALLDAVPETAPSSVVHRSAWAADLTQNHLSALARLGRQADPGSAAMQMNRLCAALGRWLPEESLSIIDSGLGLAAGHLLWPVQQPFSRMTLGQNGTIGLGIPFALGSAMAQQDQDADRAVVALVGDVGFGLSSSELETARRHGARLVVVVADNGGINGRAFQDNWFPGEGSPDVLRYHQQVDYAAIARGWGARAEVTPTPQALRQALGSALVAEGPTVISVPMAECFPQGQTEEQEDG